MIDAFVFLGFVSKPKSCEEPLRMQDFPGFITAAWTPPSSEKELSRTFYASFADAKAAHAAVLGLSDQTDLLSNKGLTFA